VRTWTLGSGSGGNAILLECASTRVLVDAGYAPRTLARRLATIGIAPESITAVIVTHEHVDHVRGIAAGQRKWGWQVFGTAGTLAGISGVDAQRMTAVVPGAPWDVGELVLECIRVPHDAAAPCAVIATHPCTGLRLGIAHDLGSVPDTLRSAFAGLDILMLESNHDQQMLRAGPYPSFLQQRIAGRNGHLSNAQSAALAGEVASARLQALVLLHLSEVNNTPRHALTAAKAALREAGVRCPVTPAPQDAVAGPFGGVAAHAAQLSFSL